MAFLAGLFGTGGSAAGAGAGAAAGTTAGSVVGTAASYVGLVASVAGAVQSADAQREALNFNRGIQITNAQNAKRQAEMDQLQIRRQIARTQGAQAAGWGASGISGDSGSALDILSDTMVQGELDIQRRQFSADATNTGYTMQADLLGRQASDAGTAGGYGAASRALLGAGDILTR